MKKEREPYVQFRQMLSGAPLYENHLPYPLTYERKWVITKGRGWPKCMMDGNYLYVTLPDGEIRFTEFPRPQSKMHHPELVNGRPVIAAGIFMLFNCKVLMINNESGHYMPDVDSVMYAKLAFQFWGIPLAENLKLDSRWAHFR